MNFDNENIKNFIDSITEHGFKNHRKDLRNERSSGKSLSPGKSKGESLNIVEKDNFRQHLRETLTDPNTKYFVDDTTDRIVFYNDTPSNRTVLVFNPSQMSDGDGHAGTLMRQGVKDKKTIFNSEYADVALRNNGVTPEIRSVSDGKWVEHLEKYSDELANTPKRVLAKGDLPIDYTRARDFKAGLPYEPDVMSTKLTFPDTKGTVLSAGMVVVAGGATLYTTGSPAQAGDAIVKTVKPEYWDAVMMAVQGKYDDAFEESIKVTPGVVGCGGGALIGALGGGGWGSVFTGAAGCEGGARIVDDMSRPYVNNIIAEHRYPTAQREADLAAQQAITPDPEIIALHEAGRDAEREARYVGFDQGYDDAALNAATNIDTEILPPNLEILKYRLGGELPEEMLPQIPTGDPNLALNDDAQWMASTENGANEPYTEAAQLIERINDPYFELDPVEYRQGHGYLTNPNTPDAVINLLESQYPDGMQKLRNEELGQLDKQAGEAVAEMDRKVWFEQQNTMDPYQSQAANDPDALQTQQMAVGGR